jgi:hypothetical protein
MCNVTTTRAKTKAHLVTNGVIDKWNNILNLNEFRKVNRLYSENATSRFGTPKLMFEENGKVIFNESAFRLIDAHKGINYPDNLEEQKIVNSSNYQLNPEPFSTVPEPILDTLRNFLLRVNPDFRLETLDELNDNQGISVGAVTKLNEFLIQIKRGNENAIPEEVAHVFVEMLDKGSKLYKEMESSITMTKMYQHVLKEYGSHPEYKGNYEKLKREAMAKLVSLYTHNKALAAYYSGSPDLWSKMRSIIQNIILRVKGLKNPFNQAAMRILSLETTELLYSNAMLSDTMYQIHDLSDFRQFQTLNKDLGDYDTVLINVNDSLLDLKNYTIPDRPSRRDPEKIIPGKAIKGRMWSIPNSEDLKKYYTNSRLTKLGRELKDKIKIVGSSKFVFFTSGEITQELRDRLENEFGPVKLVSTRQEDMLESEDGTFIMDPVSKLDIVEQEKKGNTLVVDNTKDFSGTDTDFVYYNNGKVKYTDYGEMMKRRAIEAEAKEFSEVVLEEFKKLSPDNIVNLAKPALKLISRIVNRIENEDANEEGADGLSDLFKDKFGNLTIPIDRARQIIRQLEENSVEFSQGLLNFVNSIGSTTLFWENANKADFQYLRTLLEGSKEDVNKGIKDAAVLMRMILQWEDWLKSIQPILSHPDFQETKVLKERFAALGTALRISKERINKLSVDLLTTQLADVGKDYNVGKMAALRAGQITQEEYDEAIITPQKLANIIFGLEGDVAMSAYFENSLFIGDDLIQTVSTVVERSIIGANQVSLANSVELINDLGTKENNEAVGARITGIDKENYIKEDGTMDQRDVLMFHSPHKNVWVRRAKEFEVEQLRKKFYEAKALGEDTPETLEAHRVYEEAFKEFKAWEKANWNREFQTETWEIYEKFGLVGEDFDRALEAQERLWDEKKSLVAELKQPHIEKEEQIILQAKITNIENRIKNLRNPFDVETNRNKEVNNDPEKDKRISDVLKRKHIIDRQLYDYKIDNKRFLKDLNERISQLADLDLQRDLSDLLDTNNPLWLNELKALAEARAPQTFIDWVELNTKFTYSESFYENRKKIIDDLKGAISQLGALLSKDQQEALEESNKALQSSWEELFNISSSLRDENGVFDASDSSLEHQELIKQAETEINILKALIKEQSSSLDSDVAKALRKKIIKVIEELSDLQSKQPTDYYNEVMFAKLEKIYPKELGRVFENEDFLALVRSSKFQTFLQTAPQDFLDWFNTNHFMKEYEEDGEVVVDYKPTYIWMKITPNNTEDILLIPNQKYSNRKIKDNVVVEFEDRVEFFQIKTEKNENTWDDVTEQWLPKSDEFRNEAYYSMNASDRAYHKKLVDFYRKVQKDAPKNTRMGYKAPFMHKTFTDGGGLASLWKSFTENINPVESGEENATPLRSKFADRLRAFVGLETKAQREVQTDLLGNKISSIHTPYKNYIEEKDVTRDVLTSVLNYSEGLERTKALIGNVPELNLLEQLLEQFNPFEKDLLGTGGRRVKTGKNRRLEVIQNIKKTKLYGDVKDYELGRGLDKATLMMRNWTSLFSQSIINPANSLKNYIQGMLTNIISVDADWADSRSIMKAMKSAKTSFIPFISELGNQKKSLDFQIVTLFNLSMSQNVTDLFSKTALKRQLDPFGKFKYISSEAAEFSVTTTLLYAHLFHKKVMIDGVEKPLYDVFYLDNGVLKIKEAKDGDKVVNQDYINELVLKTKVITEHVQGKQFNSTVAQRFTIWRNFEFFKKYFIPKLRERFVGKRKNLVMGNDIEGFYVTTFKRFLLEVLSYLDNGRFSGVAMSPLEIVARRKMTRELITMLSTYLLITFLFGYDDDDEEKNDKLKENSWATNFSLMTMLAAKKETDAASIIPLLNTQESMIPPLFNETYNFVKEPFMGFGLFEQGKKLIDASFTHVFNNEDAYYDADMKAYFIEEGDSKLGHRLKKLMHYDAILYLGSPEYKIQSTQSFAK